MHSENDAYYKRQHLAYSFVCITGGSLLWIVLSLPLITAGPATAALYYALANSVRRSDGHFLRNFMDCFRRRFKVNSIIGSIFILFSAFLVFCIRFSNLLADSQIWLLLSYIYTFFLILLGIIASFLFPLLSRTSGSLWNQFRVGLLLSFRYLFTALTCFLVIYLCGMICSKLYALVIFAPSACCLVNSMILEPVFSRYSFEE